MEFIMEVKKFNNESGKIENIGTNVLYNNDDIEYDINKWINQSKRDFVFKLYKSDNTVGSNYQFVQLYSTSYNKGYNIDKNNYKIALSYFTARRLIVPDWLNCHKQYLVPNINHELYNIWNNDCIIFSIFDSQNKIYPDNPFFFIDVEKIKILANKYQYRKLLTSASRDIYNSFIYSELLNDITISDDAREVLILATELVLMSMGKREEYSNNNPSLNLDQWDINWRSMSIFLKSEYCKEYKKFQIAFTKFKNRLKSLVYTLEFLK